LETGFTEEQIAVICRSTLKVALSRSLSLFCCIFKVNLLSRFLETGLEVPQLEQQNAPRYQRRFAVFSVSSSPFPNLKPLAVQATFF
jgi:hypothetical protein